MSFYICLVPGGMCAFPWTEGEFLRDRRGRGQDRICHAALLEQAGAHPGGEAQTLLHPSVPG